MHQKNAAKQFVNTGIDALSKQLGSGITQTNNEIKDIIKIINSLESNEILSKGTSRKIISQEERLLNFLGPLMKVRLPLMNNVLTPLAKIVLISLELTAATSAADVAIEKKCLDLA